MKCSCGGTSYLSPDVYMAGANDSRMACEHCGEDIHFGPAVAGLRDGDDPALRDETVNLLAWYHTSTSSDWPSEGFATRSTEEVSRIEHDIGISQERYIAEHTTKALHVGTYETAIENMLRRMHDQLDGKSQFYLYRVALHLEPGRINRGYRDENHEIAADVRVMDLESDGLDAVRYLNVHEAAGVLSLAVRPGAIVAVQSLPIPLETFAVAVDPSLFRTQINEVRAAKTALTEAEVVIAALAPVERRMMEFGMRPDPGGLAKRAGRLQRRVYDSRDQLEQRLARLCLPNTSAVVRKDFNYAMAHRQDDDSDAGLHEFVERYRSMAFLLEQSTDVMEMLTVQPWRVVNSR